MNIFQPEPATAYPVGPASAERAADHLAAARRHLARAARHLGQAVLRALAERRRERARRRQIRLLAELDTRTLKDIGLHRAEIASLADELDGRSTPTRRHAAAALRAADHVSPLY